MLEEADLFLRPDGVLVLDLGGKLVSVGSVCLLLAVMDFFESIFANPFENVLCDLGSAADTEPVPPRSNVEFRFRVPSLSFGKSVTGS